MLLLSTLFLDLGKIYVLRNEAQIAADAAALAGASGFIDAEGEDQVVPRVHQYVNENLIAGDKAAVDSIIIDVGLSTVHVVLGYQTGPLLLSESGLRLQARAGAGVVDAAAPPEHPSSEPEESAPTKKVELTQ
jgi:hypothetical protein